MSTLKNIAKIFTLLYFLLFLAGCEDQFLSEETIGFCPTKFDQVTWQSYGKFGLKKAGNNSIAWKLVGDCDWRMYNNHVGLLIGTLQVASPDESVVFTWSGNNSHSEFIGFDVVQGWYGKTDKGISIGASTSSFHRAHPEFVKISSILSEYYDGYYSVYAHFDVSGHLQKLSIGYETNHW